MLSSNFGISVWIRPAGLYAAVLLAGCIAAAAKSGSFRELPEDLPLPALPIQGLPWTRDAIIIQPWGYTQPQMMREGLGDLPEQLRGRYGFNVLCVMPPTALAAVGGGEQTEAAFTNALAAYRKAGYKIMLYTSQVNAGHDPLWYKALKEHPEWKQINPKGQAANWLCPNNSASFEFNLKYTKDIVGRYGADAILLDNNMFASVDDRVGVACYCEACQAKFRSYVDARFGRSFEKFFDTPRAELKIPTIPGPLYNLWKQCRNRSYAETTERVRRSLPGMVVVANTQYWWWTMGEYGWALASDLQYPHEDMVLSESYGTEAYGIPKQDSAGMSTKLVMGCAIAGWRPLCDLIGTFEWNSPRFEPLKPAPEVQRRLATALMYLAQPWLGYYGMEGDDPRSVPSREVLSRLLVFRAKNTGLYTNLRPWGSVGSILPNGSYNCEGPSRPVVPPHVLALRSRGIPTTGLYDLTLCAEELAKRRIVVAENVTCLPPHTARLLVSWVKKGGILVTTDNLATRDEIGRERGFSKIANSLGKPELKSMSAGKGRVLVAQSSDLANQVSELVDEAFKPECSGNPPIEIQPYVSADARRLVLHVTNHGARLDAAWRIRLPASLSKRTGALRLFVPGSGGPVSLQLDGPDLLIPPIEAYAVIEMSLEG